MYAVILKNAKYNEKAKKILRRFAINPTIIKEKSPLEFLFKNPFETRDCLTAMQISRIKAKIVFHV